MRSLIMEKLVGSLLVGVVAILGVMYILKILDYFRNKKVEKEWLYFCRTRLHRLALRYQNECMEVTKKVVKRYSDVLVLRNYNAGYTVLSEYGKDINELKKDYLSNYALKYSEGDNQLRGEAEDLPAYILDEYTTELEELTIPFHDICRYMHEYLESIVDSEY